MPIYRAVPRASFTPDKIHTRHPGSRLPANVPYFIDNLWEFKRPHDQPSRRHAVYASPTIALALEGAAGMNQPQDGFIACRVELKGAPRMRQLSVRDARYHPDVKHLQRVAHQRLMELAPAGLEARLALAPLFLPGLTQEDMGALRQGNPALDEWIDLLAATVTVWTDAPDKAAGEWLFELGEGDSYTLHPV